MGASGSLLTATMTLTVNQDPEAPVGRLANYDNVGDLFEVLPALEKEFKALLSE